MKSLIPFLILLSSCQPLTPQCESQLENDFILLEKDFVEAEIPTVKTLPTTK